MTHNDTGRICSSNVYSKSRGVCHRNYLAKQRFGNSSVKLLAMKFKSQNFVKIYLDDILIFYRNTGNPMKPQLCKSVYHTM